MPRNQSKAVRLWKQAANQGHTDAQKCLGLLVPHALRQLEATGDAEAHYELAGLYSLGNVVPQDTEKAVKLYHQAAAQGHAAAQEMVDPAAAQFKLAERV